jgi:septal ring factor EnvC (AmiA/AmiB activator)
VEPDFTPCGLVPVASVAASGHDEGFDDDDVDDDAAGRGLTLMRGLAAHGAVGSNPSLAVAVASVNRWIANLTTQYRDVQRSLKATKDQLIKTSRNLAQVNASASAPQ